MGQTYKGSGVDIEAGDKFVDIIAPYAKSTYRKEVMDGIGPFAAMFSLDLNKFKDPVIVSSTDGVGTKLKLAIDACKFDTIGQDLVAMCVNDLICCGAEPLFFLDYFATGELKPSEHAVIIKGIANACKECGCSLIGGETAEMPGLYAAGDFDLAGFSVGAVGKADIIDGSRIIPGDVLIGIDSSGVHSNGYSLVRKIVKDSGANLNEVADMLLAPTKLYPRLVSRLLSAAGVKGKIKGIAHITGGGLEGNVPRVFPKDCAAVLDINSWQRPEAFRFLQKAGNVEEAEMRRVFNLGIGLVLATDKGTADALLREIKGAGENARVIGEVIPRKDETEVFFK